MDYVSVKKMDKLKGYRKEIEDVVEYGNEDVIVQMKLCGEIYWGIVETVARSIWVD